MSIFLPIISFSGFLFSIIGFSLSVDLKVKISDMQLEISRTAFFRTREIFISQLPYLQLITMLIFLFMSIVRIIEYLRIDYQMKKCSNSEYYLLKAKLSQALEWSNIAVTQAFIMLTLTLSLVIGIIFTTNGKNSAEEVYNKFNRQISSQNDKNTLNDLEDLLPIFTVVQVFNGLCLGCVVLQFLIVIIRKIKL